MDVIYHNESEGSLVVYRTCAEILFVLFDVVDPGLPCRVSATGGRARRLAAPFSDWSWSATRRLRYTPWSSRIRVHKYLHFMGGT